MSRERFFTKAHPTDCFLSNRHVAPIVIKSLTYQTVEHYIQAQKFPLDALTQARIRNADTPSMAIKIGQEQSFYCRQDWEMVRNKVIRKALTAKFTQHKSLREKLLAMSVTSILKRLSVDENFSQPLLEIRAQLVRQETKTSRTNAFSKSTSLI
ncbi:hypothetical protein DFS34DRAFT_640164 [Phlyctochytrium arcticum]|nr:hypothetical protein DFS34DRAFT_640164 [Phlyctochytrium arcticum]